MGNVSAKQLRLKLDGSPPAPSASVFFAPTEARATSDSSSKAELPSDDERDLEDLISRTREDAFMKAVLSFCAHMGGRMDSLDNARLYDEFCSYAAAHRPNVGLV